MDYDFFNSIWNDFQGVWHFTLIEINKEPITVKKVVIASAIIFFGYLISRRLETSCRKYMKRKNTYSEHHILTVERLVYYFCLLTCIFFGLHIVRIPLTTFTFLGGALAVGIGFGAQNLLNNFISGFIIMAERPIKVNDVVEVDGQTGVVSEIGSRCTGIITTENIHKLIPNSAFLEKTVTNWTHRDNEVKSVVSIGIAYESDIHEATKIMLESARQSSEVANQPEPFIIFQEHGESSLNFEVHFWAKINNPTERMLVKSQVNYNLNDNLRAAGIEIAYPQLDVHFDKAKVPLEI